jgi:hypothetical protein
MKLLTLLVVSLFAMGCSTATDSIDESSAKPVLSARVDVIKWDTLPTQRIANRYEVGSADSGALRLWIPVSCQPQSLAANAAIKGDSVILEIKSGGFSCADWTPVGLTVVTLSGVPSGARNFVLRPISFSRSPDSVEFARGVVDFRSGVVVSR